MKTDQWPTLVSAFIVAAGWYVTAYLNRRKDVAAKRLEHRLSALKSFLPVWFAIQRSGGPFADPAFLPILEKARANFQLYGLEDEIEKMEAFIKACEKHQLQEANAALGLLVPMVRERIRKELEIQ